MKKSLFLTFWFSLIPGAGQMYQNYTKRGLSLMCLAGILLMFAVMVGTVIFVVPLLIVIAYSFFDTYNIRNSIGTENQIKDEYIMKEFNLSKLKSNKLLGIGIIFIGVYLLLNNVLYEVAQNAGIEILTDIIRVIRNYLPSIIVAAITIGVGTKMISKN